MNPWNAQAVAAERTKDLHRQAATRRLAREAGRSGPISRSRPLLQLIAIARTASPKSA